MSLEALAHWRHPLATLVTAAFITLAVLKMLAPAPKEAPEEKIVMRVSLAAPPKVIAPLPVPQTPTPPKPQPQKQTEKATSKSPIVDHPKFAEAAATTESKTTEKEPAAPPAPPAPVSPPAPAAPNLEAGYQAQCTEAVEKVKRYPTSKDARLQQPAGTVTVVFVLNREGVLQSQEIEDSAGGILDEAAHATVKRAHCGPFPAGAWPKESEHRFRVKLNFNPG